MMGNDDGEGDFKGDGEGDWWWWWKSDMMMLSMRWKSNIFGILTVIVGSTVLLDSYINKTVERKDSHGNTIATKFVYKKKKIKKPSQYNKSSHI